MNTNIALGQYLPSISWIHQLDPRAKLICTALAVIFLINAQSLVALVLASLWTLAALGLSGIRARIYWQSLKPLWILLMISFILQALFTSGEPLLSLGIIELTKEGLIISAWFFWRMSTLLLLAAELSFTTTPLQLTVALEWLLAPLRRVRVPVSELAMIINLALRFTPSLFDEAAMLLAAQRSRGVSFNEGSLRQRIKKLIPFIVPLLTNIFKRADELAFAMEIRCYQVDAKRTKMHTLCFATRDYVALIVSSAVLALVIQFSLR